MIRLIVIATVVLFSTQAHAELMSRLINGDNRTIICNLNDDKANEITYIFDNPLNHVAVETSFYKNQVVTSYNYKDRPIWLTDHLQESRGDVITFSYTKDFNYKLVINNRPSSYDKEEGFPQSIANLWKKDAGIIAHGECHVVTQ